MNLIKSLDNISEVIRSLDGIGAALHQLSMDEDDVNNNFFTILFDETRRDINLLLKQKKSIQKALEEEKK